MYFKYATPESVGIKSSDVLKLLTAYENSGLAMHSVLMARGDKLFCEAYWSPFTKEDNHRMYSQTKSYVGIAVMQLASEGKIDLNDKITDYFPEKMPENIHPYLKALTIKNMLNMQTCFAGDCWFKEHSGDRIKYYFSQKPVRYPGTTFFYDSTGSFVLGALVEKVTGKTFLNYLKEKCLNKIGFSESSKVLSSPGGYAWGDSALLCRPIDMMLFGRLIANKGVWNGEQLLNSNAVEQAINTHVYNKSFGNEFRKQGYGCQIWGTSENGFAFFGMHGQFTVYNPKTDILFVCTAGYPMEDIGYAEIIFRNFFREIVDNALAEPISVGSDFNKLSKYISERNILSLNGADTSPLKSKINNRIFKVTENNPMGIKEFSVNLFENYGEFNYTNAQGAKTIKFGINENIPQLFPQYGYSKDIGGVGSEKHMYKCVASGAWVEPDKLGILVQIIDEYIGILDITIGFNEEYAVIDMKKSAEFFLEEYSGYLTAKANL